MTKFVRRNLYLKSVRFRYGRKRDVSPPRIDDLLRQVRSQTPNFSQRHYPPPEAVGGRKGGRHVSIANGQNCIFISNIRDRVGPKGGLMFDVSSYVYGMQSDQFRPDFDGSDPDIQSGPIQDKEGNTREILHSYRCVALGQSLIVEYNKGAGGLHMLSILLAHLFRTYCDKSLPTIELMDVVTDNLSQAIKAGGGVSAIELKVIDSSDAPKRSFISKSLNDIRKKARGAGELVVQWRSEGDSKISEDFALKVANDCNRDSTPLSKISIRLKDGPVISSLESFRARREIEVQVTSDGAIAVSEIESGMWNYLDELRMIRKGWRILSDDGYIIQAKTIKLKGK